MSTSSSSPGPESGSPSPTVAEEREEVIRALEEGQARRRTLGIRWPTALLAITLAVGLFAWQRMDRDLAYFFSPTQPLTLGSEGDYAWENLRSNRYAQIHGIPTFVGVFSRHAGDEVRVTVGLQGTPVLVHRAALPTEDWPENRPPSAVDQRPFGVRGRLLVLDEVPSTFRPAFERLGPKEGIQPRDGKLWLLLAEQSPRKDLGTVALASFLFAFVLLNVWLGLRDIASRRAG